MVSKLIDSFRDRFQSQLATPQPLQNQTEQVQQLQSAKSGKAFGPTSAPRISNIQEQVANQQAQQAVQQNAQQMQLQGEQAELSSAQQEQEISSRFAQMEESAAKQMDEFLTQSQNLVDQYTQGLRTLDLNKDKARLESIGLTARLANDKYVNALQQEAARARLDNELQFNEALARSIFGQEQDMFQENLTFRNMLSADNREFVEELSGIDLGFAMQMASDENRANAAQTMWTGIGGIAGAGVQAYDRYEPSEKEVTQPTVQPTADMSSDQASSEFGNIV